MTTQPGEATEATAAPSGEAESGGAVAATTSKPPRNATESWDPESYADVYDKIVVMLKDEMGVDKDIEPDSHFQDDLDMDSLDGVEMVMEFEDGAGIKISDEDAQKLHTSRQTAIYIADRIGLEVPAEERTALEGWTAKAETDAAA